QKLATPTNPGQRLNARVAQAFATPPASMRDVAELYGKLFNEAHKASRAAEENAKKTKSAAPKGLADPALEELRQVLYAADAPPTVPALRINEIEPFFDEPTREALSRLQMKVDQWHLESPDTPPHALVLRDTTAVREPRVFIRGNPKTKGDEVPRRFLEVLAGDRRRPFGQGSGRRELVRAITSPDNPLTARVLVNRVWLHHFGAGLVRTPSDFGLRSEPPSHPELLDYLAWRFMADGWSIKRLHRLIV